VSPTSGDGDDAELAREYRSCFQSIGVTNEW